MIIQTIYKIFLKTLTNLRKNVIIKVVFRSKNYIRRRIYDTTHH